MRVRKRLSVPLLVSFLVLAYTLVEEQTLVQDVTTPPAADARAPESYAADVVVRDFAENGELLGETIAQDLRRYKQGEITELDAPQRRGHDGDSNWIVTAQHGMLRERQGVLVLDGDVSLQYVGESVEFNTESMTLNLRKRTALSNAPVRVIQADNTTDAQQLFAELGPQRATLKGSVKTRYVPEA